MSKKDPKKTASVQLDENDLDQAVGGLTTSYKLDSAVLGDGSVKPTTTTLNTTTLNTTTVKLDPATTTVFKY
ncbi:MAG: hypothetical protein KDE15_01840 [Erythrobacter sp.]|nr:hypothetical protein [Erythrobacter sp.]